MGDDEDRRRGAREERLDRLAGGDVEVVRRLVEEQQVRGHDPEERELEPRPLAARQEADLLEHVVALEQEPGEIAAGLAGGDRHRPEDRVEHRRARDRRVAQLGEVADLDRVAEAQPAVERLEVAGDRAQQGRLAGPVRTDDADPLAARRGQPRGAGDRHRARRHGRHLVAVSSTSGRRPGG